MKITALAIAILGSAFALGCSRTSSNAPPPTPDTTASPARGGASGGRSFDTVLDLAHHYKADIIVPLGVPVGAAEANEDASGELKSYGYDVFGKIGVIYVYGAAPPDVADYDVLPRNDTFSEVRRSIVQVRGRDALLIQEQNKQYPHFDSYRILWSESGKLVQAYALTAGSGGHYPTAGPDALVALANATVSVAAGDIDAVNLVNNTDRFKSLGGQVESFSSAADAERSLGSPIKAPAQFASISVLKAGAIRSYTVDLDQQGMRRVFIVPESPADVLTKAPEAQRVTVNSGRATFDSRTTASGNVSLLFFSARGRNFMLRDVTGGPAQDLVDVANTMVTSADSPSASCCSLLLDMDPATPGVQATRTVTGQQDISIDVVLGDTIGELGGFNFSLVYDDTRLAPVTPGAGGINGNPDFNDAALGAGWNCSMPGASGRADIDAATGAGHGVAFLACFVTGAPPTISSATVVATLQLRVTAAGASDIAIADAQFAHYDATEIGSCNPVTNAELTCAGGSVTRN